MQSDDNFLVINKSHKMLYKVSVICNKFARYFEFTRFLLTYLK